MKEVEIGTKHRYAGMAAYVTAFWNRFDPFTDTALTAQADGTLVRTGFVSQTVNYGVELEGNWRPIPAFELSGNVTLQRPRYRNLAVLDTAQVLPEVEGNLIRRFPKVIASLSPTFDFTAFGHRTQAYATLSYQGKKYVDSNNSTELPAYTTLDAGFICDLSKNLRLQLMGSNLTNEIGLTEGNPRTDTLVGQGAATATYARPIFGRAVRMSLTYSW